MTRSWLLQVLFLVAGIALFAIVLADIELGELVASLRQVGFIGFGAILLLYLVEFLLDVLTWQATIVSSHWDRRWVTRLFWFKIAGEAFNNGTPTGGVGGEPIKAVFLNRNFGIGYGEAIASLILYKTIIVLSLILFLGVGFALMLANPILPDVYNTVAAVGFVALAVGVVLFFLLQRFKIMTRTGNLIFSGRLSGTVHKIFEYVRDMDDRLVEYYTGHRKRFYAGFAMSIVNWVLGAAEVYLVMLFLGHPVTMTDAVIIEVFVQLVRAGTFFIPSSIGAQEGAFLVIGGAVAGVPTLGVAMALVRRIREIIWIAWGFAVFYFLRPETQPSSTPGRENTP